VGDLKGRDMNTFSDLPKRWHLLLTADDDTLASTIIEKPQRPLRHEGPPPKGGRYSLPDHLTLLQGEHAGRPRTTLAHAALVVLIRRELAMDAALARFFTLWEAQEDLLLKHLSLRWLVSAADTFADYGRSDAERMAGLAVSLFVNTIKIYETERNFILDLREGDETEGKAVSNFDLDGVTPFRTTHGDALGNLYVRKQRVTKQIGGAAGVAGRLLDTVMERVKSLDTAFSRFQEMHIGRGHKW